jgi:hypothetical protein
LILFSAAIPDIIPSSLVVSSAWVPGEAICNTWIAWDWLGRLLKDIGNLRTSFHHYSNTVITNIIFYEAPNFYNTVTGNFSRFHLNWCDFSLFVHVTCNIYFHPKYHIRVWIDKKMSLLSMLIIYVSFHILFFYKIFVCCMVRAN